MQNGIRCAYISFNLLEQHSKEVVNIQYKGGWTVVDNGYLAWSMLIPPVKLPTSYAEMCFSRCSESMRKDVECTFGIMKSRFRILKTGISLQGVAVTDRVWKTCCALHNFCYKEMDWMRIGV